MSPALFDTSDFIAPVVIREWSRYPVKQKISRNATVKRTTGKEKVRFSSKKMLLELRKDRVSRRLSTAANSGQLTSSDSSISSDDEVEPKKKIDIESTDDEDFDAYCEEIRKMAPSLTETAAPSSGFELPSFTPSHQMSSFDQIFVNFCMAEFTSEFSSTAIDTSEFLRLDAYKKIVEFVNKEKKIREDEKEQQKKIIEVEHNSMIASEMIKIPTRI